MPTPAHSEALVASRTHRHHNHAHILIIHISRSICTVRRCSQRVSVTGLAGAGLPQRAVGVSTQPAQTASSVAHSSRADLVAPTYSSNYQAVSCILRGGRCAGRGREDGHAPGSLRKGPRGALSPPIPTVPTNSHVHLRSNGCVSRAVALRPRWTWLELRQQSSDRVAVTSCSDEPRPYAPPRSAQALPCTVPQLAVPGTAFHDPAGCLQVVTTNGIGWLLTF